MRKIGIVGGVAWQSTVEHYTRICRRAEWRHHERKLPGPPAFPEMVVESLDHRVALDYLGSDEREESWSRFDGYFRAALRRLERSGAAFGLIASNTAYHRFPAVTRDIGMPVLNILELAARESARLGAKRVLVLGNDLIMRSARVREAFAKVGVEASGPGDEQARRLVNRIIEGALAGRVGGAAELVGGLARASDKPDSPAPPVVCLASTELPLAFPEHQTQPTFDV